MRELCRVREAVGNFEREVSLLRVVDVRIEFECLPALCAAVVEIGKSSVNGESSNLLIGYLMVLLFIKRDGENWTLCRGYDLYENFIGLSEQN